ncbi:hypothetical protein [Mycoplasma suis]|uniref:Uncharacterized protein n=1 Tax=Mycoplasma suis (strain Illinois) TaxID=768700 RepID=F0QRD3_MYCSL|nr:hypothetical protein [Mycoplasma suis]ADX98053.1 hypothetical protein MSU_0519 [Mycoplasma suis str. Illinois]
MIFFNNGQQMIDNSGDIYLATRLLMMFYWLTIPSIALILIWSLYSFPKMDWSKNFPSFSRFFPYLKNLSIFGWVILGTLILINTILLVFYAIDTLALNNVDKYAVYWKYKVQERPVLSFFAVTIMGFILYWILAIVCYNTFWEKYFNSKLNLSLKDLAKKLFSRY